MDTVHMIIHVVGSAPAGFDCVIVALPSLTKNVCRPFWYASGATIQVLLFAILAIHVKLKAPRAHTGEHTLQFMFE